MDNGKIRAFSKRCLSLLAGIFLVFTGLMIFGQGCTNLDKFIKESQKEHKLTQQMKFAEDELKRGNLLSARTLFEWVRRESKRPSVQERALFFSAFTTLLDKKDKNRWDRGQQMFMRTSEEFTEGEFGQISGYVAAALSDVLSAMGALQKDNASMQQKIDLKERSHTREMDQLVKKQKKQLSKKKDEIAALKNTIRVKNGEIESLRLKIKKLEEIHKEIKKKRKGLS